MGYGHGTVGGKEVGYMVLATCEEPGCDAQIDRGMDYACGGDHGDSDNSCDGYFCGSHRTAGPESMGGGWFCQRCLDAFVKENPDAWDEEDSGVVECTECGRLMIGIVTEHPHA